MPFTPVHALITLPFLNKFKSGKVSATALVIGSMAPDIEYFIKMHDHDNAHYGHTAFGIFHFDIPLTILSALLFHLVIKKNLINNLPTFFQRRLQTLLHFDFLPYFKQHYVAFIGSALIGILSHFFMDAFTHEDGFFATMSFYPKTVIIIHGLGYPFWYAVQQIVSVVGLGVLAVYFICLRPDPQAMVNPRQSLSYWFVFVMMSLAILSLRFSDSFLHVPVPEFVITTISAAVAALVVCGFLRFNDGEPISLNKRFES